MLPVVELERSNAPGKLLFVKGHFAIHTTKSSRDSKKGIRRRSSYGSAGRDSEASVFVTLGLLG